MLRDSDPTPHILLIDNAPDQVRALVSLIGQQHWRLSMATNSHQGYQRALALKPDLILLDVRMPGMDGFTLCRLLREASATCRIPVIFLANDGAVEERLEGLSLGGVDYVLKECDPREVLARIRIHLQLIWREDQLVSDSVQSGVAGADEVYLRAAMRLIGQRLEDMPSLAEIARKVGTHDKRLSSLFREQLGTTVFGYIREARMRRSQELLANGCMEIRDIAERVGFRSACNFTTAFRERLGITPSRYRQQAQNKSRSAQARPCS